MKLRPFIAHTSIFASGLAAGLVVASSYFLFSIIPSTKIYVSADLQKIQLADGQAPIDYISVLQQDYLGSVYLKSPAYFFRRQEGYDMLADLANQGYSLSAMSLYFYEIKQTYRNLDKPEIFKKHYVKAYHWAMLAANQGFYLPLQMMVKIEELGKTKDITEELAMLENWAKKSSISATALALHEYYDKQGNKEKAQEWLNTAEKIREEHRPKPACTTITPFRGW